MPTCSGCSCIKNIDDGTKFCGMKSTDGFNYGCNSSCCVNCNPTPYLIPVDTSQIVNPLVLDTTGQVQKYKPDITDFPRWWYWMMGLLLMCLIIFFIIILI
jgi:hypothetical protein